MDGRRARISSIGCKSLYEIHARKKNYFTLGEWRNVFEFVGGMYLSLFYMKLKSLKSSIQAGG
jgi:hypothetical protein